MLRRGFREATRSRRNNRLQGVARAGVSEHLTNCLQWQKHEKVALATLLQERRSTSSPGGGPQQPLEIVALHGVFSQKFKKDEHAGGGRSFCPLRRSSKRFVFARSPLDPSKTQHFCHRKLLKHNKTRGFGLAKAAKPRTGRLQTVFFSSWSLPAAPGHRFPRAVWLQGARPFASLAPGGVSEQPLQKHEVLAIGRRRNLVNHEVSATHGTPKYIKKVATLRVFARFARTAAGTETIIIHRNLVKHECPRPLFLQILSKRRPRRGLHGSVLPDR